MKILIGTPIHISKDYAMERWLKNVSRLEYPADLLLIDNSPGLNYVNKVKGYCKKLGIKNYRAEHLEIDPLDTDNDQIMNIKIEAAQEMIRRETLKGRYDAWFSWECDQIIPDNALNKLVKLIISGNYMMVVANSWARTIPGEFNTNMGCTLISNEALKRSFFLPGSNGNISLDLSDSYSVDEMMFKKRILKGGGNYVEIYGIIDPIYHLNK